MSTHLFRAASHPTVMVTNGGAHSPLAWAQVTIDLLLSVAPEMEPEKRARAEDLRVKARAVLVPCFKEVKATTTLADVQSLTAMALDGLKRAAAGSEWSQNVAQPDILAMMADVIRRNLSSAADAAMLSE